MFDATVLDPTKLTKALDEGGVPSAIATLIPEKASEGQANDRKNECQNTPPASSASYSACQPTPQDKEQEKLDTADMKAKIASVVTPEFINQKIQMAATSVIVFMKNGTPQPTIDISDFPAKLKASGVEVGDGIGDEFNKPIELNKDGALDKLPGAYKSFKLVKYVGVLLFALLLTAEWFVTEKGQKLRRTGRIFLYAAFWYTVYWSVLVFVPARALPALKDKAGTTGAENTLIDAFIKSIQHLFGTYLIGFAIVCWVIALAFYLARHGRKHIDKIQAVPDAKNSKSKPKDVSNRR